MNKKGQSNSGLITGLVIGIAGLVIGVIVAFLIITSLTGGGLFNNQRVTNTVANETGGYINSTGYTLAGASASYFIPGSVTITDAYNSSTLIGSGNYTVSNAGVVTNASATTYSTANFSYTYQTQGVEEASSNELSANFSSGVGNVSTKIPTVMLVAVIVLLLSVLAILVAVWKKLRLGGSSL